MAQIRADAARSRARILDAARARPSGGLRLNDVARDAGLGVGTVYRHFPSVHALTEALAVETLERMVKIARAAAEHPDTESALATFLGEALALQLQDGGLQAVLLSPDDEEESVRAMKREIFVAFDEVLQRARDAKLVRADLSIGQIERLVCGVEHAVRIGEPSDRHLFLGILLAGIRPAASSSAPA
ncbi:AcrR family transcriptional regulator [Microbacterium phyllosphaerae]|uniref:AcrR family transcriptional regulator n=1 Tax=Microbacterium phyllosphaerae TaxID=124798 RepID=A0ABS4WLE5_9MICO|nr:TetR family transcriptional regulator [Microbacterium phyllosphaerae]MBP2376763.1 AcrR family transcriptional regulator [Microbacterium phyllosphaerae]